MTILDFWLKIGHFRSILPWYLMQKHPRRLKHYIYCHLQLFSGQFGRKIPIKPILGSPMSLLLSQPMSKKQTQSMYNSVSVARLHTVCSLKSMCVRRIHIFVLYNRLIVSSWIKLASKMLIFMPKLDFPIVNEVGGVIWLAQDLFQMQRDVK